MFHTSLVKKKKKVQLLFHMTFKVKRIAEMIYYPRIQGLTIFPIFSRLKRQFVH